MFTVWVRCHSVDSRDSLVSSRFFYFTTENGFSLRLNSERQCQENDKNASKERCHRRFASSLSRSRGSMCLEPCLSRSLLTAYYHLLVLQDPLVLSSNALPEWSGVLTSTFPFLFPFETRQLYFSCTAFGSSR